jgi:glycosyltransferase involved in cell wall biosynthesis
VGTLEPRKNLPVVFEAFARVKDQIPHDLIVVGAKGWRCEGLVESVRRLGIDGRTVFTGYVDDDTLSALYARAEALIYPSLYEGFGLPPLEAMAHRCPTIVSNAASLVELTGDAALRVDPCDVVGMAAALLRVTQDPALREDLARRSLERAARFSWRRTAEETLAVYQSLPTARMNQVARSMDR